MDEIKENSLPQIIAPDAKGQDASNKPPLNERQLAFVNEYLVDMDRIRAYKAVYDSKSANAIRASSLTLLRDPRIQSLISAKTEQIEAKMREKFLKKELKLEITKERVMLEIARVAFFDIRNLFDVNGNGISIADLDDDTAAAISGIDISAIYKKGLSLDEKVAEVTKKFKTVNKGQMLELLAKHFNIVNEGNTINDDISITFEDISQQNYKGQKPDEDPDEQEDFNP